MPRAAATTQPGAVPKRLMSLAEFLSNYSVSRSEFYRLCAKGAAPAICKIGRKTLVPFDAAEEWLQARIRPASELCRAAAAAALIVVGLAIAAQPVKAQMFDTSPPQQVILPQADTVQAAQQACIGAVVNGVCAGTAAPDAQTATCYGQMVGGVCAGSLQGN